MIALALRALLGAVTLTHDGLYDRIWTFLAAHPSGVMPARDASYQVRLRRFSSVCAHSSPCCADNL